MKFLGTTIAALLLANTMAVAEGFSNLQLPAHAAIQNPAIEGESWALLRPDVVDDQIVLLDGEDLLALDAPVTAFDAATVPFSIQQRLGTDRITKMTVVVDDNPMPIVGEFEFGPAMGEINFESRVRFDIFSNLRVVAETESGGTYMAGRFVQAAGGCSAAVTRDPEVAFSTMGRMKLRLFENGSRVQQSGGVQEAQLMIRHPMFTGLQVRHGTFDHIDPRFITDVEVFLGEERLFSMVGGFSISEDPSFRFSFVNNGAQEIRVRAVDTEGAVFEESFPINQGA